MNKHKDTKTKTTHERMAWDAQHFLRAVGPSGRGRLIEERRAALMVHAPELVELFKKYWKEGHKFAAELRSAMEPEEQGQ